RRRLGDPLEIRESHQVTSVAFSPDGTALAAGYAVHSFGAGGVILYDVAARRRLSDRLTVPEANAVGVAFSPDGQPLAVGYQGGVIFYDIAPESWQRRACAIANRNLSWEEWRRLIGPDVPYRRICPELPDGKGVDEALGHGAAEGLGMDRLVGSSHDRD